MSEAKREPVVGLHMTKRVGAQRFGVYKDGRTALIFVDGPDVYAQFDDVNSGFGYGWWKFRTYEWKFQAARKKVS